MPPMELPGIDDLLENVAVVAIPMRVRFRGVDVREAALLRGPGGWGEFAPFREYGDPEAARWLDSAIESAWPATHGEPVPVHRAEVPVNATVPAVDPGHVPAIVARFDGCRTAKVKVAEPGQSLADDLARVAAVRDVMGPAARVRIDANGAWSVDDAIEAVRRLARYDLEYVEQPCATVADLARTRIALAAAGIDVPIAADESIRKAQDPALVARAGAADLIVVKVAPLGGVRAALRVVGDCGLPAVVSSAIDTSVGIAAGVRLAAALPDLKYACGLGTVSLLAGDVSPTPLRPAGGAIPVAAASSAALAVTDELLDRWSAPAPVDRWWRERIRRCHSVLARTRTRD